MPILATIIAVLIPVEVWAEDSNQWSEIRTWKGLKDNTIPVLILRDASVSEEQVDIVERAINSKEVKNSRTQFLGWNEGIKEISKSFGVKVPLLELQQKLESTKAITIYLMDRSSGNRHNGYTELFYDENKNIQKAFVKIYNADELNRKQLESIIRHELGHALGLGHTDKKNDLMNSIINLKYNTISLLDLHALAKKY